MPEEKKLKIKALSENLLGMLLTYGISLFTWGPCVKGGVISSITQLVRGLDDAMTT